MSLRHLRKVKESEKELVTVLKFVVEIGNDILGIIVSPTERSTRKIMDHERRHLLQAKRLNGLLCIGPCR
jgi:hypothetical protein